MKRVDGYVVGLALLLTSGCLDKPAPWTPGAVDAEVTAGDLQSADGKGEIGVNPLDGKGEVPAEVGVVDAAGDGVVPLDVHDVAELATPDAVDAPDLPDLPDLSDAPETEALSDLDGETQVDVGADAELVVDADLPCIPDCKDKVCGDSDGCGGMCTACPGEQELCVLGKCECIPACEGKDCGPDGCDGSCGDCGANEQCSDEGLCECLAEVVECGDVCCAPGEVCHADQCCLPDCEGKECGSDGCGGNCGECDDENPCTDDYCLEGGTCQFSKKQDGTECELQDGCVGTCLNGECVTVEVCDGQDNDCDDQVDEGFPNYDEDEQADCVDPDDDNDGHLDDVDCEPQNEAVPSCEGKECGEDGCGGNCGDCDEYLGSFCDSGTCACVPDCAGKECGADGCGGSCGQCKDAFECATPICQDGLCDWIVDVWYCLVDGECIQSGTEKGDNVCQKCSPTGNQWDWTAAPDGVECAGGHVCFDGECCNKDANCQGKECGDDGCGGVCGTCAGPQDACVEGSCKCQPACEGKECGDDGCNGTCGSCFPGQVCIDFTCPPKWMKCYDGNEVEWDGCTNSGEIAEFQVNKFADGTQEGPSAATFSDGRFVVAWERRFSEDESRDIAAQLYDANGVPLVGEFQVNENNAVVWPSNPSVATFVDGSFVVVWEGEGGGQELDDVMGRLYDVDGTPSTGEFKASSSPQYSQGYSSVVTFAGGGFLVAWNSAKLDYDIAGQFFNADGSKVEGEVLFNTYTGFEQKNPAVAAFPDDRFVVSWQDNKSAPNKPPCEVITQFFHSDGSKNGQAVATNTYKSGVVAYPSATVLTNATTVVVWESSPPPGWDPNAGQDGDGIGVFGQILNSDGSKWGDEFQVNTSSAGNQQGCTCRESFD